MGLGAAAEVLGALLEVLGTLVVVLRVSVRAGSVLVVWWVTVEGTGAVLVEMRAVLK